MTDMADSHEFAATRRWVLAAAALVGASAPAGAMAARVLGAGPAPASARFVARVCDIVIPATRTGGAVAAGVPRFLVMAFASGVFGGDAETLVRLERALDAASTKPFLRLAPAAQVALLTRLDRETYSRPAPPPPRPSAVNAEPVPPGTIAAPAEPAFDRLWRIVKTGIVVGYYTSEIGGSQELAYQLAAGPDYRADVDVAAVPYLSNLWMENAG